VRTALRRTDRAFTRTELVVVGIIVLFVVAGLMQVKAVRMREAQVRETCINNLREVAMTFRVWNVSATGGSDVRFPMAVSTNEKGSMEHIFTGETFRHFQAMSNELGTPRLLACPAESRPASPDFGARFSNSNLSYFVGVDAEPVYSQMLLAGDGRLTNRAGATLGMIRVSRHDTPWWDGPVHGGFGIVALVDGSTHQMSSAQLWHHVARFASFPDTNRLALPLP
jgi:hypothetical protein